MASAGLLRAEGHGSEWHLVGSGVESFRLINEFLGYLADRAYSSQTVRAYAFDLLAFARWLVEQRIVLEETTTEVLPRFLTACRTCRVVCSPANPRRCLAASARCASGQSPG